MNEYSTLFDMLVSLDLIGNDATDAFITSSHMDSSSNILPQTQKLLRSFTGLANTPLLSYTERVLKHAVRARDTCDIAAILLHRLRNTLHSEHPQITSLPRSKLHRLILASVVLAIKLHCDECESMTFYASIGGVRYSEILEYEVELLELLNYDLFVGVDEYSAVMHQCTSSSRTATRFVDGLREMNKPAHDQQREAAKTDVRVSLGKVEQEESDDNEEEDGLELVHSPATAAEKRMPPFPYDADMTVSPFVQGPSYAASASEMELLSSQDTPVVM